MSETHLMLPREKEVELLMNHIEAGNCTFIFGLLFSGKTVLAHNILDKLKTRADVLAIDIDLKDFEGDTTDAALNSIILEAVKVIPGSGDYPIPGKGDREYHLKKLLRNMPDKKTVILLDSAECIKKLSDWNIFLPTIRALHVESRVVFFLFSRIRPQGFAKDPISSPAINIFEANLIKLNLLPKDFVNPLLKYLASNGIETEPVFPNFIWQHTGGHPFLIKTYMDIYRTEKMKYSFLDENDFNGLEEKAEAKLQGFYKELFEILSPGHLQIIADDVLEGKLSKNRDKILQDLRELGVIRLSDQGYGLFSIGAEKYFRQDLKDKKNRGKKEKKGKGKKGQQSSKNSETNEMSHFKADEKHKLPMNVVKKILILAANPKATPRLRLDEEVREIEDGLQRAKHRSQFDIRSRWAVRFRDLRRELLYYEPHIVHFIGHGEKKGIALEDEIGFAKFISAKAISELFKLCSDHVECVILSACYSVSHTNAINKHIDYVIGMKKEIDDEAAVEFAVGFYDALGAGKSVEKAFEFGCSAILDLPHHLTPVLKKKKDLENSESEPGTLKKKSSIFSFLNIKRMKAPKS